MDGPFHRGELIAQAMAGTGTPGVTGIRPFMPDQHRDFFALLPYLFVATTDKGGWPVATVLTGPPGFVQSPDPVTLTVAARPREGEPGAALFAADRPFGALGLDFATRRRNRANGRITAAGKGGLTLHVLQSFGNCPQYIHVRDPMVDRRVCTDAEPFAGLDALARRQIAAADTFFVATSSGAGVDGGGLDVSHRGGPPGFVQLDGNVLTIPDYRGNRYFNTLGNLVLEPRAALLFLDFTNGELLQLQGRAEIAWADHTLPHAERTWRFTVETGWRGRSGIYA